MDLAGLTVLPPLAWIGAFLQPRLSDQAPRGSCIPGSARAAMMLWLAPLAAEYDCAKYSCSAHGLVLVTGIIAAVLALGLIVAWWRSRR